MPSWGPAWPAHYKPAICATYTRNDRELACLCTLTAYLDPVAAQPILQVVAYLSKLKLAEAVQERLSMATFEATPKYSRVSASA